MSFCTFLFSFNGICLKRVFQMFRIFGLNKYYRTFKKISGMDLFLTILKNRYNFFSNAEKRKKLFIEKKRNLFLHVSYRHYLKLPVRGQRTKTNAKTRKHYGIV